MSRISEILLYLMLQEITCKKVCVGDIVRVRQDDDIPCDMVMLISSHPDSKGYVTTANLDGETNLKVESGKSYNLIKYN